MSEEICGCPTRTKPAPMKTDCVCEAAGFCQRHQCAKTEHFHNLCQTRPDYFALWERGGGPCVNPNPVPPESSRGLGDWAAWLIQKASFGLIRSKPGCGCEKRKAWLNRFGHWIKRKLALPTFIACGVTTARRMEPTLEPTLASLKASGFSPTVFPDRGGGAFRTWVEALRALADRRCRYVLLAQDDILCARGIRQYLKRLKLPAGTGCVSLYTPGKSTPGEGLVAASGKTWGACALLFPRDVAVKLVECQVIRDWPGDRRIDVAVGKALESLGYAFYYHRPSLVQHVGEVSAFGDGRKMDSGRRANDFIGEDVDALSLFTLASGQPDREHRHSPEHSGRPG